MAHSQHSSPALTVTELRRLENEAWASPARRALYSTRHVPGFPWHTVQTSPNPAPCDDAGVPFSTSVRRHVVPYDFAFTVFVKGRWVGRRLLEVYAEELPHHSAAYYEACLRRGRLYCVQRGALDRHNTQRRLLKRAAGATPASEASIADADSTPSVGAAETPQATTASTADLRHKPRTRGTSSPPLAAATPLPDAQNVVLQHGDVVYHTVHRHEVPVTVGVSGVDAVLITAVRIARYGLLCVNKPTGLPTHATGRYHYNSLTALLEYVLAPRRLTAWLVGGDPLLQSLVSTAQLSAEEKAELYAYYGGGAESTGTQPLDEVDPDKAPRPCHRLDKVTSGVLLLAVHQDAAKCIGAVLMRKAKEVEEAVGAALQTHRTGEDARGGDGEGREGAGHASAPVSLQRVVAAAYDLQKYYLARVGASAAVAAQTRDAVTPASMWAVEGTNAAVAVHNAAVLPMLREAGLLRPLSDRETGPSSSRSPESASPPPAFPSGVLCTVPVPAGGTSGAAAAAAATLCQAVSCRPAVPAQRTAAAAVVLCTPYTGRLHQIRVHLSSMGHPIVGDVVYASKPYPRITPPTARTTANGSEKKKDAHAFVHEAGEPLAKSRRAPLTPGVDDYVYFDAAQLPTSYRSFTAESEVAESPGVKRPRAGDVTLGAAAAWEAEPLCYECAGRLPIVAAGECATGTSAICLHAWVYEVNEALLLRGGGDASGVEGEEERQRSVSPAALSTRGCALSESGRVRFEAPPPVWALL